MRRLAFGIICAGMLCGSAADAQGASYVVDPQGYARMRVQVQFDQGDADIQMDQCPSGTIFNDKITFKKLMKSSSVLNLGFSVVTPSGTKFEATPVAISIEKKITGNKCHIRLNQVTYLSPLVSISGGPASTFSVTPTIYKRDKPEENLIAGAAGLVQAAANAAGAPEAIAKAAGAGISNTLSGAGSNQSGEYGVDFPLNPAAGAKSERTWEADIELNGDLKKIVIRASLENVASVFKPSDSRLIPNSFLNTSPSTLLGTKLITDAAGDKVGLWVITNTAGDAYGQFTSKSNAADAATYCQTIYQNLTNKAGLSPLDSALLVWSIARNHPILGGQGIKTKNIEQLPCVRDQEKILNNVGVTLLQIQPEIVKIPADKGRMVAAAEGEAASLASFFNSTSDVDRTDVAKRIFSDKPQFTDPTTVIFTHSGRMLDNNSDWRFVIADVTKPLVSKIGCYAYFPGATGGDSLMWAIIASPNGKEQAARITFEPVASSDEAARIARLDISSTLSSSDRNAIQTKRQSAACGPDRNWKPDLLFK